MSGCNDPSIDGEACVDTATFRSLLRHLSGAVCVITTGCEDRLHGMTATAVASVCAEPPTVLIAVNRTARSHVMLSQTGCFAINMLAETQQALALRFGSKEDKPFDGIGHRVTAEGPPLLDGASAQLLCRVVERTEIGTHTVFFGRVLRGHALGAAPLLYHDGRFQGLHALPGV